MGTTNILDAATAVGAVSKNIYDYGFLVVVGALFIVTVIVMFILFYVRTNKLYINHTTQSNMLVNNLVQDNKDSNSLLSESISKLVQNMSEVLELCKETSMGVTDKAKRFQSYTGTIKMLKNYLGNLKLELIRESCKIIEKNHIDDTEALCKKISTVVANMEKKRKVDFSEFMYETICVVNLFPHCMNDGISFLMKEHIQDRHRTMDKLLNDMDLLFSEYLNEMEDKMQNTIKYE